MSVNQDIIVIGASAGGIRATQKLLADLPQDIRAAIFVVLHLGQSYFTMNSPFPRTARPFPADLLARRTSLPIHAAVDGQLFQRGHVYVAVSDEHLVIERGKVRLENSPKETRFRPSVDVLFRSAALTYGRRVAGVVLSGMLKDGTEGLWYIKKHGGVTIVQDPAEAQHAQMPRSAIDNVPVDHCLPVKGISRTLVELSAEQLSPPQSAGSPSARVLIVEDERIVALSIEKLLRKLGYDVCASVSSGEAALELVADTNPEIVLMDINLPGMSGTETAVRIWERLQIPVVYVTAFADKATIERVKATETYGYVVKPFRPEEVDAAIQLALHRRSKEVREY